MPHEEEIRLLITKLHDNDRNEVYASPRTPQEPSEAMNKLVEIGFSAIPLLIKELHDYRSENTERFYPMYVAKTLGEIGDPMALSELIEWFNDDLGDIELWECVVAAIGKIGKPAIPQLFDNLKAHKTEDDILNILSVLRGINGPDEDILRFARDIVHQSPDYNIKDEAIELIGVHGNQKDVQFIEKFLDDDNFSFSSKTALRKILKDNPAMLREIFQKHNVVNYEKIREVGRKIEDQFHTLAYRYNDKERLEGDGAGELNEAVRDYFSTEAAMNTLDVFRNFGVDIGVLSSEDEEKILTIWRKLFHKRIELLENFGDAVGIFDYDVERERIKSISRRSFRNLYPVPENFKNEIKEWLSSQKFQISNITSDATFFIKYEILARADGGKGLVITFGKTEGKRKYGDVTLKFVGNNWNEDEISYLQNLFWNQFKDLHILT